MSVRYRSLEQCPECGEATEKDGEHILTGTYHCKECPTCREVMHLDANGDGAFHWVHEDGARWCVEDDGTVIDRPSRAVSA